MKRNMKTIVVVATAAMLTIASSITALAQTGWVEKSGKWYYYNEDGSKLINGWVNSGDSWFWINSTGNMSTNRWVDYNGEMYYFLENGAMATNKFQLYKKKTYYLGADGRSVMNQWVKGSDEKWRYMNENRELTIGFKEIDGGIYYFDGSGYMLSGMSVGGYQLGEDGRAIQ